MASLLEQAERAFELEGAQARVEELEFELGELEAATLKGPTTLRDKMSLEDKVRASLLESPFDENRAINAHNLIQAFERNGLVIVEVGTCQR